MSEQILVKTVGGPKADTRVIDRGKVGWPWPPPAKIHVPGEKGFYQRESYSQIPAEPPMDSRLMRGAQYKWIENRNKHADKD